MASYQAYINSYQHLPNYFYNWALEEAYKAAANINKFNNNFVNNLELYQSFKILYAHI